MIAFHFTFFFCNTLSVLHVFVLCPFCYTYLSVIPILGVKGFQTEDEMEGFLMNDTDNYLAGVVFTNHFRDESFPNRISYKLRFSSAPRNVPKNETTLFKRDTRWQTQFTFPLFQRVGPRENNYVCGGAPGNNFYLKVHFMGQVY